jgi:hypothetical protein
MARMRPTRTAARTSRQRSAIRTTLRLPREQRLIVVAQGIEFHDSELRAEWRIPECLVDHATNPRADLKMPGLNLVSGTEATYDSADQNVTYKILVIESKREFHQYLEGTHGNSAAYPGNVLVVYGGHARYGRGPCLGANSAHGNHWGTGSDPRVEGIFRMGYPYLMIPVTEILSHGYKAMVARQSTTDPNLRAVDIKTMDRGRNSQLLHPGLRPYVRARKTRGYSLAEIDTMIQAFQLAVHHAVSQDAVLRTVSRSNISGYVGDCLDNRHHRRNSLQHYIYGQVNAGERFWATYKSQTMSSQYYDGSQWRSKRLRNPGDPSGQFRWPWMILHADWRNTVSGTWRPPAGGLPARMDLGATRLNCRGFCHFGCSTKLHNYRVMRQMKRWQRSRDGNNRLCYWTTESAYADINPYWLYHMLTYIPGSRVGRKTFLSRNWEDVCEYTKACTNLDLDADGRNYNVD